MSLNINSSSPFHEFYADSEKEASQSEIIWVNKIVSHVKNQNSLVDVQKFLEQALMLLKQFHSPKQVILITALLDKQLKQECKHIDLSALLTQKVASLVLFKGTKFFDGIIKNSRDKQFASAVILEFVKMDMYFDPKKVFAYLKAYEIDPASADAVSIFDHVLEYMAEHDVKNLPKAIKQFIGDASKDPEAQNKIYLLLKKAAQNNGKVVSETIHNYGIDSSSVEGQQKLIQIAKLSAQQDGLGTSQYIQNYRIDTSTAEGRQALMDIAKIAAQKSKGFISYLIQNYGLHRFASEEQQVLLEIALLAAEDHGRFTSEYIQNYGFDSQTSEGQKALILIAKEAAKNHGEGTAEFIQNYHIDDTTEEGQQALLDIAKLGVLNQQPVRLCSNHGSSKYIQNFGIQKFPQGEKHLLEIAHMVANENIWMIPLYINNFGIHKFPNGGNEMKALALEAVEKVPELVADNIHNFCFDKSSPQGRQALIEVFKRGVVHNAQAMLKHIEKFALPDSTAEELYHFKRLMDFTFSHLIWQLPDFELKSFFEAFLAFKDNIFDKKFSLYSQNMEDFCEAMEELEVGQQDLAVKKIVQACKKHYAMTESQLKWLEDRYLKNKSKVNQKRLLKWFLCSALLCSTSKTLKHIFKTHQDVFYVISKQHPKLREDLVKTLISLGVFNNLQGWKALGEVSKGIKFLTLPCMVLANYPQESLQIYKTALENLKQWRVFREGQYQKLLLETLIKIDRSRLPKENKSGLIQFLFSLSEANLLQALRLVSDVLAFKGESNLVNLREVSDIQKALEQLFQSSFQVHAANFSEMYGSTIALWRNKEALTTYAGKLNELPLDVRPKALEFLQSWVRQILYGTFQKNRYEVTLNPHLAQIHKYHPEVLKKWQEDVVLNEDEAASFENNSMVISPTERIVHALKLALEQGHLGSSLEYPFIMGCKGDWSKLEENLESVNLELTPLANRPLSADESEKKRVLLLQKKCLELFKQPNKIEQQLLDLKSLLSKDVPFYKDVEDAIKMLHSQAAADQASTLQVIDSDHPNHFLLMGTEVLASCQHIGGRPPLNVCLLGYILDGKHRLALVLDSQGKIVARSVLRLLIDDKGNPVLYLERMYVADDSPNYENLIKKLALKKAAYLGIPLVTSVSEFDNSSGIMYPSSIHAREKPVPFEYVDALGGQQEGSYSIVKVCKLS